MTVSAVSLVLAPSLWAGLKTPPVKVEYDLAIPSMFTSSSETTTLEWGCPVSEVIHARTPSEAIQKITNECIEEVQRAAHEKPEVYHVIQTSVIWPDVNVSEAKDGFFLRGTFFLETLVLRKSFE